LYYKWDNYFIPPPKKAMKNKETLIKDTFLKLLNTFYGKIWF